MTGGGPQVASGSMALRPAAHPFLRHDGPLAFAHRGGTESAPENSLAAFAAAVEVGFDYLETDLHLTADGVIVAIHDEALDRVTDTTGAIAEMTWQEVSRARLAGREPIPTFEELLEAFPQQRFNIDPKSDPVVEPLIDLLVRSDALERVCVGAFSQHRLQRVRERFGTAICTAAGPRETARVMARARLPRRGAIVDRGGSTEEAARTAPGRSLAYDCLQVPVRHRGVAVVTPGLISWARDHGIQVHVWTVDDPPEMARLLDMGVDGIMTDRPSVLRRVLEDRREWPHDRDHPT